MADFRLISGAVDSYEGLSTDSKPSSARVGSKAKETDTGDEYTWDGLAWIINIQRGE